MCTEGERGGMMSEKRPSSYAILLGDRGPGKRVNVGRWNINAMMSRVEKLQRE